MKVIDKILNEWSFRCHDGIVDMNNPEKVKILFEVLKPILKEDIDDDILNLLSGKDIPTKEKILTYLQKLDKGESEESEVKKLKQQIDGSKKEKNKKAEEIINIRKILISHGLSRPNAYFITGLFIEADKEDELIDYFKNPPSLEIIDGVNVKTKPKEQLQNELIDDIYNSSAGVARTKGIGREENFLVIFYGNVTKEDEGDIKVDGIKYEVKGVGSMVVPSDVSRGSKKNVIDFLKINFIDKLNISNDQKNEITNIFGKRERWTYTISNLYKKYPDKDDFYKNIKEALNKKYPGIGIDEKILEDGKLLATTITKYLIKESKIKDKILFISPEGVMKVYELNTLIDAIGKEINITGFSDFAPRLTFKDPENDISKQGDSQINIDFQKESETTEIKVSNPEKNIKVYNGVQYIFRKWYDDHQKEQKYFDDTKSIQNYIPLKPEYKDIIKLVPLTQESSNIFELANTDHFQLRLGERGNVLDILNLKEIPLKNYNSSEVKEKLKANISEELKTRANNILSKDIPSSTTYDIGIKVLKPVLVVDNKKYPLKLFAISTKEVKDKEGNVVGTVEVENRGTLYFATIADNKATTLMLLDKEDDNDLYFQVKSHITRKKGEDKEAKILAPPNYIYEIDLDELMGNKVDQGPTLIDPTTLEYTLRTDYRKGANFTHKKYGTGKIVNTSSGTGGEGDSNGRLDWVDVDYGKPILKSGKLVPYRRFENILTLVSPLLSK